jgi:hypothetical protein
MPRLLRCCLFGVALALLAATAAAASPPSSDSAMNEYQENPGSAGGGQAGSGDNHHGAGSHEEGHRENPGSTDGGSQRHDRSGIDQARPARQVGDLDARQAGPLPPRVRRDLARHGEAGTALSNFTEQTGTAGQTGTATGARRRHHPASGGSGRDPAGIALKNFAGAGSDSGTGLGVGFLIALAALSAAALVLFVGRRRGVDAPR